MKYYYKAKHEKSVIVEYYYSYYLLARSLQDSGIHRQQGGKARTNSRVFETQGCSM